MKPNPAKSQLDAYRNQVIGADRVGVVRSVAGLGKTHCCSVLEQSSCHFFRTTLKLFSSDPQRSASIGNPAAPPFVAVIPIFSSADTIRRATSFASSVAWWNSRLEIDRAGVRIFSRFIRMT